VDSADQEKGSLLERLARRIRCGYLSNLRWADDFQRLQLSNELEQIHPDAVSLEEWNDALQYLANAQPDEDARTARKRLIFLLSQFQCGGEPREGASLSEPWEIFGVTR
jgi:hypothetical protein